MSQSYDPYHLKSPTIYMIKIVVFLLIIGLVIAILSGSIITFFWANPFINSLIILVAATGVVLSFRQIQRLYPEIKWVNSMQDGTMARVRQPVLLAPVAGLLRDRLGEAVITPASMRSILDSVGNRLDEAKDTSRYLTGLLVFLGLLGTFYGLLETVTHVAATIQALDTSTGDTASVFANLKAGLAAPLGGMGTA
ncbi:MAG: flagellar motor protein MotA, partial [Devosia sp.]